MPPEFQPFISRAYCRPGRWMWLGLWVAGWLSAATGCPVLAQTSPQESASSGLETERVIRSGFLLAPERGSAPRGRVSLPIDPIEAAWVNGRLTLPPADSTEESPSAEGLPPWRPITADDQGYFSGRGLGSGWLLTYVDVPAAGVWMLSAVGAGQVRVNGVPRVGDIYSNGIVEIPIELAAGRNTLLFMGTRGRIHARLAPPTRPLSLSTRDTTFPTILRSGVTEYWGALMVVNATAETQTGLQLRIQGLGLSPTSQPVPPLPPLSVRKVPFQVRLSDAAHREWSAESTQVTFKVELTSTTAEGASVQHEIPVTWELRDPNQPHRRTFVSRIDGSVQYFGVVPPPPETLSAETPPALLLTLHGAGVEGEGQANAYQPKPNMYIIAPTNRRVFGFDWEDWGRLDALEVLELASELFATDPRRTYLSGHSMGGHGTWHLGTLFPDRFAAIGPSAGWISFSTYGGGGGAPAAVTPANEFLRRAVSASDTLARVQNLATQGVYILHGDADDNVPVGQARTMRGELAKFHPNFVYKEQPGAGHWWGNPCVDWPPMLAFFAAHQLPESRDVRQVDFTTPSPHVSATYHWATVVTQLAQGEPSRLELQWDPSRGRLTGTTVNVRRLRLDTRDWHVDTTAGQPPATVPETWEIALDGATTSVPAASAREAIFLERTQGTWQVASDWTQTQPHAKNPRRSGFFKSAFDHRFVLVYGTGGSPEENQWMLARARWDAETFWYRGNGSVDVVPDTAWPALSAESRNVIVYGNASINAAWQELLADSPVQVTSGEWRAGDRSDRESASLLLVRPRPQQPENSVGAIGGTDLKGMQATWRLPIFSSGTGYPDWLVVTPDYLTTGSEAVRGIGFFGDDWSWESGEWTGGQPAAAGD